MAAVASQNILRFSRQPVLPLAGWLATQRRGAFTVVKPGDHSNLASYRRGRGGRSSFSGVVATVFGATSVMGKNVVNRLGLIGSQVICPYRGEGYLTKDLKLAGDLGQILFMPYDIRDEQSIRKAVKYSNVVVNLVNLRAETKNFSYDEVNHVGARRIATICREMGVERFIHLSRLSASHDTPGVILEGGSKYLKSKAAGEDAVREAFPDATIFRAAAITGWDDKFVCYYVYKKRRWFRNLALWNKGLDTIVAPVCASDLTTGIANAIQDPKTKGMTYEAYGPRAYILGELCDYIIRENRERYSKIAELKYCPGIWLRAMRFGALSRYPPYNVEILEAEHHSDIITDAPNLEDLGVTLSPIEPTVHYICRQIRAAAYQEDPLMEDSMEEGPHIFRFLNKSPALEYAPS